VSFKNAFKLLLSRFSCVWVILLYLTVMFVVLLSLGLTFLLPVIRSFSAAGIGDMFNKAILSLLNGASIAETLARLSAIGEEIRIIFSTDRNTFLNSALFVVLVATVAYRFIMGLYELPLVSVIQGIMSDNARYGYMARYVSLMGKSVLFSLVKMLVMTLYDSIMYVSVFYLTKLAGYVSLILSPFAFMLSLLLLLSLRYSLIAGWSPAVIVDGKKIFPALWFSVKQAFAHFGSIFSMYLIVWVIIIAFNFIIGTFTFLAGLLVTVPVSMFFINLLNMTFYYGRSGKSYYVDNGVYTPETFKNKSDLRE
jgi:membrane protein